MGIVVRRSWRLEWWCWWSGSEAEIADSLGRDRRWCWAEDGAALWSDGAKSWARRKWQRGGEFGTGLIVQWLDRSLRAERTGQQQGLCVMVMQQLIGGGMIWAAAGLWW